MSHDYTVRFQGRATEKALEGGMTREDAIKSMDAVVQCLCIQVEKSVCDDVFGHWIRCKESLEHRDAEQRAEIESLSSLLDVANKGLLKYERQIAQLEEALEERP